MRRVSKCVEHCKASQAWATQWGSGEPRAETCDSGRGAQRLAGNKLLYSPRNNKGRERHRQEESTRATVRDSEGSTEIGTKAVWRQQRCTENGRCQGEGAGAHRWVSF